MFQYKYIRFKDYFSSNTNLNKKCIASESYKTNASLINSVWEEIKIRELILDAVSYSFCLNVQNLNQTPPIKNSKILTLQFLDVFILNDYVQYIFHNN